MLSERHTTFKLGDRVRKIKGSAWQGRVVGAYSTVLTPEGYAVESEAHPGSVQIYPAGALEPVRVSPCAAHAYQQDSFPAMVRRLPTTDTLTSVDLGDDDQLTGDASDGCGEPR